MATPAVEADYFADDPQTSRAARRLRRTADPAKRAGLLLLLGDSEWRRAGLHPAVFGDDPHDSDGCPAQVWMRDSARLLWVLAEAEHERSQRTAAPLQGVEYAARHDVRTIELQRAVDWLLDRWVEQISRRSLLDDMLPVWLRMAGGQAVEAPYVLGRRLPWWAR